MSADDRARERSYWQNLARGRPRQVARPGPGQESVWDYPRPPRLEHDRRTVRVELGGELIAQTTRALRVLETASPPTFYLPPDDVRMDRLEPSRHATFCEWKGQAAYWSARVDGRLVENVAWSYPDPDPSFAELRDHLAFFPGRVDACWVNDDRVVPQPGGFYGGWITPEIVGPFKGDPGTGHW